MTKDKKALAYYNFVKGVWQFWDGKKGCEPTDFICPDSKQVNVIWELKITELQQLVKFQSAFLPSSSLPRVSSAADEYHHYENINVTANDLNPLKQADTPTRPKMSLS